jgi:tRNA pseudouridine38-40 synthase
LSGDAADGDDDPVEPAPAPAAAAPKALYRIELAYVGTAFHGWQSQSDGSAIQDAVERALRTILRHPVRLTAASRTDTGVHAEHQVATFRTDVPPATRRWAKSLGALLPPSVGVLSIASAAGAFHPVRGARGKAYVYRLWRSDARLPMLAPLVWELYREIDVASLAAEVRSLEGRHDFTSFCAADSSAKTRVRTLVSTAVVERGPLVEVWLLGEGFLKQMVRTIVGSAVAVASGRRPGGALRAALDARSRPAAGQTAPACGLTLARVFYDELPELPAFLAERAARGALIGLPG